MVKLYWLFVVIIVINIIWIPSQNTEVIAMKTLQDAGVKLEKFSMHYSAKTSLPKEQMQAFLRDISRKLPNSRIMTINIDGMESIKINSSTDLGNKVYVTVTKLPMNTIWFNCRILGINYNREISEIKDVFNKILLDYNINAHTDFSFQGSSRVGANSAIVRVIEKNLSAKKIESLNSASTTSISAYSPYLDEGFKITKGNMNLQIASRMNYATNTLIFTLGSPVITIEY